MIYYIIICVDAIIYIICINSNLSHAYVRDVVLQNVLISVYMFIHVTLLTIDKKVC